MVTTFSIVSARAGAVCRVPPDAPVPSFPSKVCKISGASASSDLAGTHETASSDRFIPPCAVKEMSHGKSISHLLSLLSATNCEVVVWRINSN